MTSELIYKYLSNEASEQEVQELFDWIDASEENKSQFITLKKTWTLTAISGTISPNTASVMALKPKNNARKYFSYAAVLVVLIGLAGLAFYFNERTTASKEIVLELSDGSFEYFTQKNENNLVNSKGELIARKFSDRIVYFGKVLDKEVSYHTLTVPYGKRFKLTLSDGTFVSLNSGTTLRYPEQFGINGKRNVYLTGEAFFEVAKDKQHPFIVHSDKIDIEVLGTKFNVTAYPEDKTVSSVLVEGSIQMSEKDNPLNAVLLKPSQMAVWQNESKKIVTQTVDTAVYEAWTQGELVFQNTPFSTIAKIIERTYDVEIINENTVLARQNFTGSIKISESSVANILELLKRDTPFNYSIKQNTITITPISHN
ncbi:FecR family protein [Flavobacterium sp. S87F.05.LMB.W.Kidney.N]|uniref:FecR family protein n=1 Tax=Flavobacterium sp. S87F.05.LMB.W.Kidney.N TaxID=1278758 RepID=UPI001065BB44|nr:FecR domain-containing protein [Flavobacterium sp. S87F.05.LMB.W.Kidney.N]TDX10650.1 FecR family protein [Flavobacterium sp. S87F.05.LMB.W.Kidney.N]